MHKDSPVDATSLPVLPQLAQPLPHDPCRQPPRPLPRSKKEEVLVPFKPIITKLPTKPMMNDPLPADPATTMEAMPMPLREVLITVECSNPLAEIWIEPEVSKTTITIRMWWNPFLPPRPSLKIPRLLLRPMARRVKCCIWPCKLPMDVDKFCSRCKWCRFRAVSKWPMWWLDPRVACPWMVRPLRHKWWYRHRSSSRRPPCPKTMVLLDLWELLVPAPWVVEVVRWMAIIISTA
mmetsp:Transcript_17641/g.36536  ORF Transcript_17641/g.36536 Transcript_17641/m.36536 type:complete len:235 (+) Transcript_17641:918-1622(+)